MLGRMSPLHGGVGLSVRASVCRDEGCCVERLSSPKFSSGNKREKREEKRNRERRERERERVLWEGEGVSGWKKRWTDEACNERGRRGGKRVRLLMERELNRNSKLEGSTLVKKRIIGHDMGISSDLEECRVCKRGRE